MEALLRSYVSAGGRVLDPFAGSGTTLVQALESGHDAVGIDVAAFNCLLAPRAAAELLHVRSLLGEYEYADVLRVVLCSSCPVRRG